MTGLRRDMPIRDPEAADSRFGTDYDAERGGWYPPEQEPTTPKETDQ